MHDSSPTSQPPAVSSSDVRALDRFAIEELGMPGLLLMENAGRGVADFIRRKQSPGRALIACGPGNNGGDGFVIARHLDLAGWSVDVLLTADPATARGDAAANLGWLGATECRRFVYATAAARDLLDRPDRYSVVVDAILGTGSRGLLRDPLGTLVSTLNRIAAMRVAVDLPTGLDSETGSADPHTFRADHTCTFVAPKPGLLDPAACLFVGQLEVVGIGVPRAVLQRFGVSVPRPACEDTETMPKPSPPYDRPAD